MTQGQYVASKKDIIIFFIISIFYSIVSYITMVKPIIIEGYILLILFFFPEIIAIIINAIIKHADIKKERVIKLIKILFNILTCIHFVFFSILVYAFATIGT